MVSAWLSVDFVVARPRRPTLGAVTIRSAAVSRHPRTLDTRDEAQPAASGAPARVRDRARAAPRVALVSCRRSAAQPVMVADWSASSGRQPRPVHAACGTRTCRPDARRSGEPRIDFLREVKAPKMPPTPPHQPPWMLPLPKVLVLSCELGRVLEPSSSLRRDGRGSGAVSGSGRKRSDADVAADLVS